MKESVQLRKRFCKDFNIPITVFDSPYFEERLEILDGQFNCVELYADFMEEVSAFKTEVEYFEEYNRVKDAAITYIKQASQWDEFSTVDAPALNVFPKKELYSDCNDGKIFYSIDMRRANFSTVRTLYPSLVGYKDTWEEFIGMFTDINHIKKSKYIRQVIMGACNPKKQTQWEKFLMENVAMSINSKLNLCKIISVSTDEILIESESPCSMSIEQLYALLESCISHLLKVTKFRLKKVDGFGWVKQYVHPGSLCDVDVNTYEFKCVEGEKFHIVTKLYDGVPLDDNDFVFYHNGLLAKYIDRSQFNFNAEEVKGSGNCC